MEIISYSFETFLFSWQGWVDERRALICCGVYYLQRGYKVIRARKRSYSSVATGHADDVRVVSLMTSGSLVFAGGPA